MDQSSFDRIARLLGGATTRRHGLAAALGAAVGLPLLADDADAKQRRHEGPDKARKKGRDKGKPGAEGPCGNGSRKDNVCKKDKECCTGICRKGLKNKDGQGRCRCLRKGKPCTEDKNCCGGRACTDGVCGGGSGPTPTPIPTGDPCVPDVDTCADAEAACTTYESGTPVGTYCLLARGAACSADTQCEPGTCDSGVCGTCSCGACAASCDSPTVCATCTYQTIQAAVDAATAGDTILIGKGTYSEDVTIDKNLNLKGCPGPNPADIVTVKNATYGTRSITITDAAIVEIIDLVIDGYNDAGNSQVGGGIKSNGKLYLCRNTVVQNGWWGDGTEGGGVHMSYPPSKDQVLYVWDQTLITNNVTDTYGGGVYIDSYGASDIAHGARITGNTADKGGGVFYYYTSQVQTVRNSVVIDGNTATDKGGGIFVYGQGQTGFDLQISGKVKITSNTAPIGGGIYAEGANPTRPEYVSLSGTVEISGNSATSTTDSSTGGGIFIEGHYLRADGDVRISGNTSATGSGGIHGQLTTTPYPSGSYGIDLGGNVVIENNTAAGYAGGLSSFGPARLAGNAIVRNNSASDGGGIYIDGNDLLLKDNVQVTGNTASDQGGGIFMFENASVTLTDTATITSNTATTGGGGIWSDNSANTLTISGSAAVTGNTPDQCAGGTITC